MSGDLDKISLADIFQTLAMSKMEGILVVRNPLELRGLFFRDGTVRDLVLSRPERHRLGQRLVHAGLITEEQLDQALEAHRQSGVLVGEELIATGAIEEEDIHNVLDYQATEDLHSLFTWKHGSFEFYKGKPEDAEILSRSETVPQFRVDAILLEAARRNDEWADILTVVHSADEILRPIDGLDDSHLDEDHSAVLAGIDGTRSIRDLTEYTVLGVFHCAHVCRSLVEMGLVEPVEPIELLEAAEQQRKLGEVRQAVVTLRTLFDREDSELPIEIIRELAASLERCGDWGFAGRTLWRAAESPEHAADSVHLLREACRIDKRSSYLLRSLQRALQRDGTGAEELADVTSRLADALIEEDHEDEAVAEIERLETMSCEPKQVFTHKARILEKTGRTYEAVAALDDLAAHLSATKDRAELISVYERIMQLDPRRKDIVKILAKLRASKQGRHLKKVVALAVISALGGAGFMYFEHQAKMDELAGRVAELNSAIDAGHLAGLEARVDTAFADFGIQPPLEKLRTRVNELRARISARHENELSIKVQGQLEQIEALVNQNEFRRAFDLYAELLEDRASSKLARDSAEKRISGVATAIQRLSTTLPEHIPPASSSEHTAAEREALLARLSVFFKQPDLDLVQRLQQAADHPVLEQVLGAEKRDLLIAQATAVEKCFADASTRERTYQAAQNQFNTKQMLQPVFLAAKRHEEAYDFAAALTAYRRLVTEYPDDDQLKAEFRDRTKRYEWITERMSALATATAKGQHRVAVDRLEELKKREPEIPFHKFVKLPIQIATTPPGALVSVQGEAAGRTPLLLSYVPDGVTKLRVHLPGFHPRQETIDKDFTGKVDLLLTRSPDWANVAPGSVERQPLCAGEHAFLVDRSGTIFSIAMASGDIAWKLDTGDLSGLLTKPIRVGKRIVVGSFDGPLRAIERVNGEIAWQQEDLPCEGSPALVGSILVVGTTEGRAVGVRTSSGAEKYSTELPGGVTTDVVTDGKHAYMVTENGWAVCIEPANGKVVWSRQIAQAFLAGPAVGSGVMVIASDDGTVAGLDSSDGRSLWQKTGLGEISLTPGLVESRAVIASRFTLHTFSLEDGRPGPRLKTDQAWCSAPFATGGRLYAGNEAGVVYVLDPATLRRRYALRGKGRISAPLGINKQGQAIAAFESKILQGFGQLP